jgi:hypothetical protein
MMAPDLRHKRAWARKTGAWPAIVPELFYCGGAAVSVERDHAIPQLAAFMPMREAAEHKSDSAN